MFVMAERYKYSTEERVFLVTHYYQMNADYSEIFAAFTAKFPNAPVPTRQTIHKLHKKFQVTGSVIDAPRSGRPRTARTEENTYRVAQAFVEKPSTSAQRTANQLDLSRSTLGRILKDLKLKVYRPQLIQSLSEDDFDRRVEFCEWYSIRCEAEPDFYRRILWSDEAIFKVNGLVNRHNCVYYATENPHVVMEKFLNTAGVMVWCGICSQGVIGPFFFEGNVNGQKYLELLEEVTAVLKYDERFVNHDTIFQQDGCPSHYQTAVRDFLNNNFQEWIGRRGTAEFPARSPDLTVADFSFWGLLKDKVFAHHIIDTDHLKAIIEQEVDLINKDTALLVRMCKSVRKRCLKCIEVNGEQFEHLL
jgi:hypothetical protein